MANNLKADVESRMTGIGWVTFSFGAALLFFMGVLGIDVGGLNISNIPSVIIGGSLLISGSVFVAAGHVANSTHDFRQEFRTVVGVPVDKLPPAKEIQALIRDASGRMRSKNTWTFLGKTYSNQEAAEAAAAEYRECYERM